MTQEYTDTLFELTNGYFIYVEIDLPMDWHYTVYDADGTVLTGGYIEGPLDPWMIVRTAQCAEDLDDEGVRLASITLEELLDRKRP